jgi:HlyD family secretion protein
MAALRFNLRAPGEASAEKTGGSFVEKLLPRPRRRNKSRPENEPGMPVKGPSKVWVLEGDRPVPTEVQVGLTDGRLAEISADGLTEGTRVILGEGV